MIHIIFVSPYEELTELGLSMIPEMKSQGVRLEVIQAIGAKAASRLRLKADAVICRGVTGVALRKVLAPEIPQIELKTTGYDVMMAIHECASNPANPKPYTVIGTRDMVYGLQSIMRMLNLDLEFHLISSEAEGRACLEERMRLGPRTIIGGSTIVGVAERRGIPAVLIRSGEESLRQALEEATRVAWAVLHERTAAEQTRISLDSLAEGIVMLDAQGIITGCNSSATRLLGGAQGHKADLSGQKAATLLPNFNSTKVMSGSDDFTIARLEDGPTVAASYFPVVVKGVNRGVVATLQEISRVQELEGNIRNSLRQKGHQARATFRDCLGKSRIFKDTLEKAAKYSLTEAGVLIYGETGTGKEIVAQSMHNASSRAKGPFVAVNCAAFPEALLESMIFGYVAGAFTGASREGKAGFFELAHGGTIFLDEISEIPLYLQGRLLRVLQEREVMRLGHDRVMPVDVRVIAASNRPLAPLTEQGLFRGDLFYRLNVLSLTLPPLRERGRDVEILSRHFLDEFCKKHGRRQLEPDEEAMAMLRNHDWPGNIRELRNLCERLAVLSGTRSPGAQEMREAMDMGEFLAPPGLAKTQVAQESPNLMREITRHAALNALDAARGNKGLAAQRLGISRTTLWRLLKEQA